MARLNGMKGTSEMKDTVVDVSAGRARLEGASGLEFAQRRDPPAGKGL
jgi:hypothetical protein